MTNATILQNSAYCYNRSVLLQQMCTVTADAHSYKDVYSYSRCAQLQQMCRVTADAHSYKRGKQSDNERSST